MLQVKRQLKIKEFLVEKGFASVEELSDHFAVSEMTIRRDLDELDKQGFIQRVHGGAMLNDPAFFEMSVSAKSTQFTTEKEQIGRAAADFVEDGSTILIDAGTTTLEIVKNLKHKKISLITNGLNIALELTSCPQIELFLVGGMLLKNVQHTVGPQTIAYLEDFHVDIAFIGVEGIHPTTGISVPDILDASVKRTMMSIAKKSIVVADFSKIGRSTKAKINPISSVDLLITNTKADKEIINQLSELTEVMVID